MSGPAIAIVDYQAGNLRSVQKALERFGASSRIATGAAEIEAAEGLVFPGQGACDSSMRQLRAQGLVGPITDFIASGKPFLGVCLGLQLLLEYSEEGSEACLGVLAGRVKRLPAGVKLPHIGWNQVELRAEHPVLEAVPSGAHFYFVHSYYADPDDTGIVAGTTTYGIEFCSAVAWDNAVAVQFHPEKSGAAGLRLYENFVRLVQSAQMLGRAAVEVIPAIDLMGGRCVRLYQGDYDRRTTYSDDPVGVAARWVDLGAARLHVVDLDGARSGAPANLEVVEDIISTVSAPVQFGGGVRTVDAAKAVVSLGVERVMVGTAAADGSKLVEAICREISPAAVVVSVDSKGGYVATEGWTRGSRIRASDLVGSMAAAGVHRFLYTDIARDGTLTEPNLPAIRDLASRRGVKLMAAGGIASVSHLVDIAGLGVEAAIVGKALYTGDVDLAEALAAVASA